MSKLSDNNQILTEDPYFKKFINLKFQNHDLIFKSSQSLFSSQDIDLGTRHLLKTLTDEKYNNYNKVLDLGAGYGPIGIALKRARLSSEVQMTDKDALAVSYSKQNAQLNNISDINVFGSLGYDDVLSNDFDLIVSNIPAKVGNEVLKHMLKDARYYLKPGGRVAIVVIDAIGDFISKELTDPDINIVFHKRWPGHLVFHYGFTQSNSSEHNKSFEEGIYDRNEIQINTGNATALLKTTYNLSEFDTLSFETELLLKNLKMIKGIKTDVIITFNPGQGFIPVFISKQTSINKIYLIDRDLQSLRITRQNLISNGYASEKIVDSFQVGILTPENIQADYVIGTLEEKDNPNTNAMIVHQATAQLKKNGRIIIASNSTAITRIESLVKKEKILSVVSRQKLKGKSLIILKHKP